MVGQFLTGKVNKRENDYFSENLSTAKNVVDLLKTRQFFLS